MTASCRPSINGWERSPITSSHGTTAALWKGSTTNSRCSSVDATGSSTCPICSNASSWIWKVTECLRDLLADTTIYGIFHGKYQRAELWKAGVGCVFVSGNFSVLLTESIEVGAKRIIGEVLFPQARRQEMDVKGGMGIDALEHVNE